MKRQSGIHCGFGSATRRTLHLYALGACYEELGDLQNAQQAFQISLDIMPKIGSSHTGDWTGVSVHAGFALETGRGQLAQGGN